MKHKPVNITESFVDGISKHGGGEVQYRSQPGSIKAFVQSDGSVKLEGWASTPDVDLGNDLVEPKAFKSSLSTFMEKGMMLFMHDWWSIPIGKFTEAKIVKDKGLWVEGTVLPTSKGKDVALLIENGVLDALSIGFKLKKSSRDEETQLRTIHDLDLFEISVVNAGMNPKARFAIAKSLGFPDFEALKQRKVTMANILDDKLNKEVEVLVDGLKTAVESAQDKVDAQTENIDKQNKIIHDMLEERDKFREGFKTVGEVQDVQLKMGEQMLELNKDIKEARQAGKLASGQQHITDWKHDFDHGIDLVFNDNNLPLDAVDQMAYKLFQQPVNFSGERGEELRQLRQLHDVVYLTSAYMATRPNRSGFKVENLKCWKTFSRFCKKVAPEFYAKALSSEAAGAGDEWVPTLSSSELWQRNELGVDLEAEIPHFDMISNPQDWPIRTTRATMYIAGEPTENNPDELTKSQPGTGKTTFNAGNFAVAVAISPEFIEDSIIQVIPAIQNDLFRAMTNGYESVVLNGDNTTPGTHMDTAAVWATDQSRPEAYEKGLRKIAIAGSLTINGQSTTAGIGDGAATFGSGDLRAMREEIPNGAGKDARELVYVVPLKIWIDMLNFDEATQIGNFGFNASFRTGDLPTWDGSTLIVSSHIDITMASTGLKTGSDATTGALCFNRNGWKIGQKRGMTVQMEQNIRTQQWDFVATMRKSLQSMDGATTNAQVAYLINLP